MKRFLTAALLSLMVAVPAWTATVGTITGRVIDDNSGDALPGVQIMVQGLGLGGITDFEGDYFIENVPVGIHTLEIRMIGYAPLIVSDVRVIMNQTIPVNARLQEEIIAGQEVMVTAERPMVEKDVTVKKMVRTTEEIQNLPARNLTEMLTLQSGIIQIKSAEYGIPGFEDRGIEQIHVRGGRSGEIGYTIDGMYIENPIYGGIGKGTRINKFAVQEMDVQTGVFDAEYGDAMSSITNIVTLTGGDQYHANFAYETSNLGALSQDQDRLRNYQKIAGSLGGPIIPGGDRFTFHISADFTTSAYRVLKFDDKVFVPGDPGNRNNLANGVNWLDRYAGWRSFGYDDTWDVFTKLHWKIDNYKQLNFSHWFVNSEFQTYGRVNQFYEEGKNVNRKWSERFSLEFRHQLNQRTYYSLSASRFTQQMKIDVKNGDMDSDGYPDWVEYKVGTEARSVHLGHDYQGQYDIPFEEGERFTPGQTIENNSDIPKILESWGPGGRRTMVTYYERDEGMQGTNNYVTRTDKVIVPRSAALVIEAWDRVDIMDQFRVEEFDNQGNLIASGNIPNGNLIDPLDSLEYRTARGETLWWHFGDPLTDDLEEGQYAPWSPMVFPDSTYDMYLTPPATMSTDDVRAMRDSLYYIFWFEYFNEGSDRYRHFTKSVTDEVKFDITSRVNKHHQLRGGVDFKRHFITFDETQLPWLQTPYGETYGLENDPPTKSAWEHFLEGDGEKMPMELGAYIQDKIEYPWMAINIGLRLDLQNSEDSSWVDPRNPASGLEPAEWKVLWSPRLGISHVITDRATFTFGYGRFFQNPTYRNIYLNDELDLTTALPIVGNSHAQAQKVSSYEFGLNWQFVDFWRLGVVGWSKDYSDLASTERVKAFPYSYSVVVNYDYGSARGLDLTLEKRGGTSWSMVTQYTLSRATANRADAWEGYRSSDTPETMPKKEVLMDYDRSHNLTLTGGYQFSKKNSPKIRGMYPLNNTTTYLTLVATSGAPYTPFDINLNRPGATNSERMPWYIETNLAVRKNFRVGPTKLTAGLIVRNLFNRENVIDIYEETGSADDPGRQNTEAIEAGIYSTTLWDRPYYYSDPRQIDLTLEASF